MAVGYDYELYVDGARVFYDDVRFNIQITDTQFVEMSGSSTGSFTYNEGQYLGWTTTQGGTTPTYEVGDIFQVNGQMYLYSIPATAPTGKTQLGTRTITKKMFGTREITKEVVNGVVVYEKQAPTPSGFTVSGTNSLYDADIAQYSTDDGVTWTNIPLGSFTLPAMTTFKLKIGGWADYLAAATSTQLGLNLPLTETSVQISDNYTLTQNITDLTMYGEWD